MYTGMPVHPQYSTRPLAGENYAEHLERTWSYSYIVVVNRFERGTIFHCPANRALDSVKTNK